MIEMIQTSFWADKGPREQLEDSGAAFVVNATWHALRTFGIAIVTDGVGGEQGGKVASAKGVQQIPAYLLASLAGRAPFSQSSGLEDTTIRALMQEACTLANRSIVDHSRKDPRLKGMATTVVCCVITRTRLYTAWAGDSRCYLWRQGTLHRITRDHSDIQDLLDAGLITPDEARDHPCAHIINRYLGQPGAPDIEYREVPIEPGDIVLLCTDGLTDVMSDEQINAYLDTCQHKDCSFEHLPQSLVDRAIQLGTQDNTSVLCCRICETQSGCPVGVDRTRKPVVNLSEEISHER